tara:strand:- start:246 stop:854 length:609 start_codon:yes stop_codon:yes gene_type:complete
MDYKKKYLKYKLKYLTAKKLYGGMDPGPDENEEMGNQGMRDRSNALSPEEANKIIEEMDNLHLGPAENENTCMNVEELGDRIDELSQEVRYLSEEFKYFSDIATNSDSDSDIDSLYGEPKSSPSSSRSPSPMRMDYSFEERKKGEKRRSGTEKKSPESESKKPKKQRIPGVIQEPGRLEYGPTEPVTSPAGAIREESDEEKE